MSAAAEGAAARRRRRPRERFHVGRLDELPQDRFHIVDLGRERVGVVRTADGVHALRDLCPHMGARLCRGDVRGLMRATSPDEVVYDESTMVVRCPWHRWEWSLETGEPIGRVTNLRAKTFEVEVVDGDVFVLV